MLGRGLEIGEWVGGDEGNERMNDWSSGSGEDG